MTWSHLLDLSAINRLTLLGPEGWFLEAMQQG